MPNKSIVFTLALLLSAAARGASYDASSNVLPGPPDFARFDFDTPVLGPLLGFNAPQSVGGGVYQMGESDVGKYTFWYNNNQVLDHTKTVEVSARLKLVSSNSGNPTDRAGLALALTDDRNFYNEFYIAPTEVFLNKRSGTTRVRDVAFAMDTTSAFHDYTFRLQGDSITILIDGVQRLTGSIFDTAGLSGVPTLQNWASIGDITSSASGTWQMQSMSVNVFVPEPATIAGLSLLSACMLARRVR